MHKLVLVALAACATATRPERTGDEALVDGGGSCRWSEAASACRDRDGLACARTGYLGECGAIDGDDLSDLWQPPVGSLAVDTEAPRAERLDWRALELRGIRLNGRFPL